MRVLLCLCALMAGCTAFMPPDENPIHLDIDWRADFATAQQEAAETSKPLLLITAAGDITGFC